MSATLAPAYVPNRSTVAEIVRQMTNQPYKLDVTKVATIADWHGTPSRYYVRNFKLVAKRAA
jgi:hypothetical protein